MISTQSPALVQHMVLTIDTVQKIQIIKLFYMFVHILSCGAMEGCATAKNTRKEELLEIKRTPDACMDSGSWQYFAKSSQPALTLT
jgi:hypothetical protein